MEQKPKKTNIDDGDMQFDESSKNDNLKYSCFLSRRFYDEDNDAKEIMDTLVAKLKTEIGFYGGKCFMDLGREVNPNDAEMINTQIGRALCESACMVLIFTPDYFRSDGLTCAKEYFGMKKLIKQRQNCMKEAGETVNSLTVIAIIVRGLLPDEIKQQSIVYEFENYEGLDTIDNERSHYFKKIKEIAKVVDDTRTHLSDHMPALCNICETFKLPDNSEVYASMQKMQLTRPNFR